MDILSELASKTSQSPEVVQDYLRNASKKYKVYSILKRSHGRRIIAQPAKELKRYQRCFLEICPLPVHSAAFAYKPSVSIKENAQQHVKNSYLLKMDLESFFNSITPEILWEQWQAHFGWVFQGDEQKLIQQLLFWSTSKKPGHGRLVLSVGAPASPALSNFCFYAFDEDLYRYCSGMGVSYSRYADDLTFSAQQPQPLGSVLTTVFTLLNQHFADKLRVNQGKTVYSSKAHNRHVTGITLTNNGEISLGRKRKRYIKHLVHQFQLGYLNIEDLHHLQGLLAFARHIEPTFIISLANKYGENVLHRLKQVKHEKKKL